MVAGLHEDDARAGTTREIWESWADADLFLEREGPRSPGALHKSREWCRRYWLSLRI
jgi:hypothetical protein